MLQCKPLTIEDKQKLNAFFMSENGDMFVQLLKDMYESKLELAQIVYLKVESPNEQIAANVNQARGVKDVIDFIECVKREISEREKTKGT